VSNKSFVIPTLLSCSFGYILAKIDNLFLNYIEKSLRILIETAKFMKVPSYETIAEVSFSRSGFVFVSVNMFILSYGAMVSYLIVSSLPSNCLFDLSPLIKTYPYVWLLYIFTIFLQVIKDTLPTVSFDCKFDIFFGRISLKKLM